MSEGPSKGELPGETQVPSEPCEEDDKATSTGSTADEATGAGSTAESIDSETAAQEASADPAPASQKKSAAEAKPSPSSSPHPASKKGLPPPLVRGVGAVCAVAVAFLGAVVQESNMLNGGSVPVWYRSLFEPHVVPPPKAKKDTCTIMFCQS
jgi:hypothetical protein